MIYAHLRECAILLHETLPAFALKSKTRESCQRRIQEEKPWGYNNLILPAF